MREALKLNETRFCTNLPPLCNGGNSKTWQSSIAMDRVKITLVALLPALWLMASGQCVLDPCSNCASAGTRDSMLAFESGQHCPSSATAAVDVSARRLNSRIGTQLVRNQLSSA